MTEENNEKLVSVIIPTYNRFSYLLNTIKYIKSQTYKKYRNNSSK